MISRVKIEAFFSWVPRESEEERCSGSAWYYDYYQDSSRCDKKVWDIWDEEAEVAVNFSKEGNWVVPQTMKILSMTFPYVVQIAHFQV